LRTALREVAANPEDVVLLFSDEVSFYRQPTQAWLWYRMGRKQPRMLYSNASNTVMRVLGVLDAVTGRVQAWDLGRVSARRAGRCWREAAAAYPHAKKVYIVLDNWPVHFHTDALSQLARDPRIELLPLPTYSPWLNNIEKLWRWVKERVTHAHPWSDDFNQFREQVMLELARASGMPELHRYCGLGRLI